MIWPWLCNRDKVGNTRPRLKKKGNKALSQTTVEYKRLLPLPWRPVGGLRFPSSSRNEDEEQLRQLSGCIPWFTAICHDLPPWWRNLQQIC